MLWNSNNGNVTVLAVLAQLVERVAFNHVVMGLIPTDDVCYYLYSLVIYNASLSGRDLVLGSRGFFASSRLLIAIEPPFCTNNGLARKGVIGMYYIKC
jgi:hypothetical protein